MWRLPITYLGVFPVHVWLGMLLATLVILQMLVGKQIIKLNHFLWHRRIIPVLILIVLFFHAWYGLSIYWPAGQSPLGGAEIIWRSISLK